MMYKRNFLIFYVVIFVLLGGSLLLSPVLPQDAAAASAEGDGGQKSAAKSSAKDTGKDAGKDKDAAKDTGKDTAKDAGKDAPKDGKEEEAEDDPWAMAWASQQQFYQEIANNTNELRKEMPGVARKVASAVLPFEQELQRIFVLGTTYSHNPRVMEAVERRISTTAASLETVMQPAQSARATALDLLGKVEQLEKTLPKDMRSNNATTKALRSYADSLAQTRKRLTEVIARLDNAMTQGNLTLEKANKAVKDIDVYMPSLWAKQYLMPPVRYIDEEYWGNLRAKITEMGITFTLRLAMEVPQSRQAWIAAGLRLGTVLLFGGLLSLVAYRRLRRSENTESFSHIFQTSVPWLLVGLGLVVASLSSSGGTVYRTVLSLGNMLLIVGQISLAWDLRRINAPDMPRNSPFWLLCAPTLVGYVLMYPEMPLVLLASGWALVLVLALIWHHFRRPPANLLQLERTFLQLDPAILWIALFMTVFGLPRYSILFYLVFATLGVALQLSVGGLRLMHSAAQHLPKEGTQAVLGSVLIACAAPAMLLLVAMAVALWVVTLPGGFYLLRHYAISGVSVGETHFNFLQVLLILSGFYITRAAISMGSSFLSKLPEHGINLDRTLIPPMQTAFTYSMWALFGAFVLKSLGMELSNLAVVAGGLSVGIGFGMQTIVNNFLSGLILIFSRILQEGDVIDVGGLNGVVRKISVRATTVETYDNAVIYVPNAEFVSNRLINWTRNSRSVRREIAIGVAYGTDPALVMRLLRETADASPDVLKYPAPSVLFSNFGNSTLDFSLRFWVHDYDKGVPTASSIRLDIEKVFRAHNVEVAFPQLDVHIKEMPRVGTVRKPQPRLAPVESHHVSGAAARVGKASPPARVVRRKAFRLRGIALPAAREQAAKEDAEPQTL